MNYIKFNQQQSIQQTTFNNNTLSSNLSPLEKNSNNININIQKLSRSKSSQKSLMSKFIQDFTNQHAYSKQNSNSNSNSKFNSLQTSTNQINPPLSNNYSFYRNNKINNIQRRNQYIALNINKQVENNINNKNHYRIPSTINEQQNFTSNTEIQTIPSIYQKSDLKQQSQIQPNSPLKINSFNKKVKLSQHKSLNLSPYLKNKHNLYDQTQTIKGKLTTIEEMYPDVNQIFDQINHLQDKLEKLQLDLNLKQQQIQYLQQQNRQKDKVIQNINKLNNIQRYEKYSQNNQDQNYYQLKNLKQEYQSLTQIHKNFIQKVKAQKKQAQTLRLQNQGKLLQQIYELKQQLRLKQKQNNAYSSSQGIIQFEKKLQKVVKQVLNNSFLQKQKIRQQCQHCASLYYKMEELQRHNSYLKQQFNLINLQNKQLKNRLGIQSTQIDLLRKDNAQKYNSHKIYKFQQKYASNGYLTNENTCENKMYYKDKQFYKKLLDILKRQTLQTKNNIKNNNQMYYVKKTNDCYSSFFQSNKNQKRKPKQSQPSTQNYNSRIQQKRINSPNSKQNQRVLLKNNSLQFDLFNNNAKYVSSYPLHLNSYKSQEVLNSFNKNESIKKSNFYQVVNNNQNVRNSLNLNEKPIIFQYKPKQNNEQFTINKENKVFLRQQILSPRYYQRPKIETTIQFPKYVKIPQRPRADTVISTSVIFN